MPTPVYAAPHRLAPRTVRSPFWQALASVVWAVGCGGAGDTGTGPAGVAAITIGARATSLVVGRAMQLTAVARDAAGDPIDGIPVEWTSYNTAFATVSSSGMVSGTAVGAATISAAAGGKSASISLLVIPVPIASISVSAPQDSVVVGASLQLTAIARD